MPLVAAEEGTQAHQGQTPDRGWGRSGANGWVIHALAFAQITRDWSEASWGKTPAQYYWKKGGLLRRNSLRSKAPKCGPGDYKPARLRCDTPNKEIYWPPIEMLKIGLGTDCRLGFDFDAGADEIFDGFNQGSAIS